MSRGSSVTRVVLPEPVLPMMAVVVPGSASRSIDDSTGCSAPGYENSTPRSSTRPLTSSVVTGSLGGTTEEGVASTSPMRSAETAARGSSTAMKVAMSTAIKIWMR